MLEDRLRHRRRLAAAQRILAAHDALQRRHLHHHRRPQVRLAQRRSTRRRRLLCRGQPQPLRHPRHEPLQPLDLVQHRAQLLLKSQCSQLGCEVRQRLPPIVLHKKRRIRIPRPDHALVPGTYDIRLTRRTVGDSNEVRQQRVSVLVSGVT